MGEERANSATVSYCTKSRDRVSTVQPCVLLTRSMHGQSDLAALRQLAAVTKEQRARCPALGLLLAATIQKLGPATKKKDVKT